MARYSRLTRADLNSRLQSRFGDGGVFWISDERDSFINEAIAIWQAMTGSATTEFDIPIINGQHFYDVPAQILSLQRVSHNGITELSLTSLHELDNGFPGWEGTLDDIGALWAPIGFNKFVIYPAAESGFLHLEGINEADLLRSTSDTLDLGDEEVTRLLSYAHHMGTFKEGTQELESTMGALNELVISAASNNGRLKASNIYRHALGLDKHLTERPSALAPTIGGRSAETV